MLTQSELKEWLHYDPLTGEWRWIKTSIRNSKSLGKKAGSIKKKGHVALSLNGKQYLSHILAYLYVTGEWPEDEINHKDGNRTNNAWTNLRKATHTQNQCNRKKQKNNKSGYKGVVYISRKPPLKNPWYSSITYDNKTISLGYHNTALEAHIVYCEGSAKYHGEFGRTE